MRPQGGGGRRTRQAIRAARRGGRYLDPAIGALVAAAPPDDHAARFERARAGGAAADRARQHQRRHRRGARALGAHRRDASQPHRDQDRVEDPRAARGIRTACRAPPPAPEHARREPAADHDRQEEAMSTASRSTDSAASAVRSSARRSSAAPIASSSPSTTWPMPPRWPQLHARDSVYARFPDHRRRREGTRSRVDGRRIAGARRARPGGRCRGRSCGVDVVIEATGRFRTRAAAARHLRRRRRAR